jgi:hypothetical protein
MATRLGHHVDWPTPPKHEAPAPMLLAAACAVLAFAVAGAAGLLARSAVDDAPPAPPPHRIVELGGIRLAVDDTWRPAALSGGLTELAGPADQVFAPAPGLDVRTIIAVAPITDPTLLPADLRDALPEQLPGPRRTMLLRVPAWRYEDVALPGGRLVDVTVAPTTAGTLAVSCVRDRAPQWSTTLWCDAGLRRIDLGTARAVTPSAKLAAAAALPGAIRALDARRVALRARLARATTRRGQSLLAARLARAYGSTAARLAPHAAASGAMAATVGGLRRASRAHAKLAGAARSNRPRAYLRARAAVRRSDRALARAIAQAG